jgi:glycosyltransferase involved in cell wall biosynthesis
MKVIHLNHSDINGGAARAAYRIHHALRDAGVDSTLWVNVASAGDWTVEGPASKWSKAMGRIRPQLGGLLRKALRTENPIIHSPAILPSNYVKRVNESDADVVHLHWVQGEMLSITDIGRIEKPIVWTLHDMWAFCGAEHYTEEFCWREGYRRDNRPAHESGLDLNRWTWERKRKHWTQPMQIVTPSRWLANCVRESALMCDWPVSVIPNCLDTERWKPMEQALARELLGLPADAPLLLFGAMGGGRDPRKGFDLLTAALGHLRGEIPGLELVVFGQLAPLNPPDLGFPIHYTGHLHDDLSLRALYSAADALMVPSRQDNLPNTAVEAQACGTPVVAFDIGGLPDIVEHQRTGYLAKAFETEDLAAGIRWVLGGGAPRFLQNHAMMAKKMNMVALSRERAVAQFSNAVVAEKYRAVYEEGGFKSEVQRLPIQ